MSPVWAESDSIATSNCLALVGEIKLYTHTILKRGKLSKPLFGIYECSKGSEEGETAGRGQGLFCSTYYVPVTIQSFAYINS